jgi:UDP-N-acetylglucosamine--N-acetylmuramyl-(pentapeptide) pyrophosphoryl-undecaprenol N-acetylglucosamine transferase
VKKILISTGGTGGHVIPAEIISEHLHDNYEIYYSTDKRGLKYLSLNKNKNVVIDTPKLNLSFFLPFKLIKLFYLTLESLIYLKKEKINKVISIGGYMSIPLIIGAKILGLKIYLLEPNLTLGRSNSFFLNFSKKIICYSDNLANFPKKFINKIELINPLVSKAFYEIKKIEDKNEKFNFLISGGSQGANFFDEIIKEVMVDIAKKYPLKVIQQTNVKNIKDLENFYNSNNIENEIFNFEKNFINLINKSDLCITRSGATSLAEISIMNKPFIAIPLPTSKDDHQMENAKFYEKLGCCWVLDQKILNKEKLLHTLLKILNNKADFINKKLNLKKLNYKNSWNDVNQKLKKIINEN